MRRSKKLDELINELVIVRFRDGDMRIGVLEYDEPYERGLPPSGRYSLYQFGEGRIFFRKTHVKGIVRWQEPIILP